jgi:amino acid transporter
MTEETHNAAMSGSIGIIMAIGVSALLGWFLILGLLFSIQDLDGTLNSSTGQPVTQIFLDTVGEKGAIVLMVIVIGAMYFCGCVPVSIASSLWMALTVLWIVEPSRSPRTRE